MKKNYIVTLSFEIEAQDNATPLLHDNLIDTFVNRFMRLAQAGELGNNWFKVEEVKNQ